MQAVKALRNAHQIAPASPETYLRSAQLFEALSAQGSEDVPDAVKALYKEIKSTVFPYESVEAGNTDLIQRHPSDPKTYSTLAQLSKPDQQAEQLLKILDAGCNANLQVRKGDTHKVESFAHSYLSCDRLHWRHTTRSNQTTILERQSSRPRLHSASPSLLHSKPTPR